VWPFVPTDGQGRFEFGVGPGSYAIRGPGEGETIRFQITDQRSYEVNLHAAGN
jgi:hypothetical protein